MVLLVSKEEEEVFQTILPCNRDSLRTRNRTGKQKWLEASCEASDSW